MYSCSFVFPRPREAEELPDVDLDFERDVVLAFAAPAGLLVVLLRVLEELFRVPLDERDDDADRLEPEPLLRLFVGLRRGERAASAPPP